MESNLLSGGAAKAQMTGKKKTAPAPIKVGKARWDIFLSQGRNAYFGGLDFSECPYVSEDEVKWDGWLIGWWSEYYKNQPSRKKVCSSGV